MDDGSSTPRLLWDMGTAYDLFVSLSVLHCPADYGLRAKWAAGVRARVPLEEREVLEEAQLAFLEAPLPWIYSLPEPKDGTTALWVLRQIPPADRLRTLSPMSKLGAELEQILQGVAERRAWDEADKEAFRAAYRRMKGGEERLSEERLVTVLKWWSRPDEYGERFLAALQSYQQVFFAEEEERIRPALRAALERGQELAGRLALPDLIEELTQGLRVTEPPQVAEWVLVPSFWSTPIAWWEEVGDALEIWLFGARPADASLVPGEAVPDALLLTLKALSDPTRLRILRILSSETLILAQLARRLRLRPQTVAHHLKVLRLAGLVQVNLGTGEGKYREPHAARGEAVAAAFAALRNFLKEEQQDDPTGASPKV